MGVMKKNPVGGRGDIRTQNTLKVFKKKMTKTG